MCPMQSAVAESSRREVHHDRAVCKASGLKAKIRRLLAKVESDAGCEVYNCELLETLHRAEVEDRNAFGFRGTIDEMARKIASRRVPRF